MSDSTHPSPTVINANDDALHREADKISARRRKAGLERLTGRLQTLVISVEPEHQQAAAAELMRYTGLQFSHAYETAEVRGCILRKAGSPDLVLTARLRGDNPFADFNRGAGAAALPNTRLETLVFETPDVAEFMRLQHKTFGTAFLTAKPLQDPGFRWVQSQPSRFTGTAIAAVQWSDPRRSLAPRQSKSLDWHFEAPEAAYRHNLYHLDHAATRVRAADRDPAILEFVGLTNFEFDFSIHVPELNSITNVARIPDMTFAQVFTSGMSPYVSEEVSGPTERFVHRFGPRVHHLAVHTESIDATVAGLGEDGLKFLLPLVGSAEEGLKQIFTEPSLHSLLVTEYIHRFDGFEGFFTRHNVAQLTAATGRQ